MSLKLTDEITVTLTVEELFGMMTFAAAANPLSVGLTPRGNAAAKRAGEKICIAIEKRNAQGTN